MLEHASPLPLVASTTTSGAHSGTHNNTSETSQPISVNTDTAAEFLARALERARTLHEGAVFSITFSDEPPTTPGQVMCLIGLVQQLSGKIGLKFQNCAGWEFRFKKLATIPGP